MYLYCIAKVLYTSTHPEVQHIPIRYTFSRDSNTCLKIPSCKKITDEDLSGNLGSPSDMQEVMLNWKVLFCSFLMGKAISMTNLDLHSCFIGVIHTVPRNCAFHNVEKRSQVKVKVAQDSFKVCK